MKVCQLKGFSGRRRRHGTMSQVTRTSKSSNFPLLNPVGIASLSRGSPGLEKRISDQLTSQVVVKLEAQVT